MRNLLYAFAELNGIEKKFGIPMDTHPSRIRARQKLFFNPRGQKGTQERAGTKKEEGRSGPDEKYLGFLALFEFLKKNTFQVVALRESEEDRVVGALSPLLH